MNQSAILLCLALYPLCAADSAHAQTIQDRDTADFETPNQPMLLADFGGSPTTATLTITNDPAYVHDGLGALEFSLNRLDGSVPGLVHPALMTDLARLDHWILSEQDASWVIMHEDRDGAVFSATLTLPAGQWVYVDLVPSDFILSPGSPVVKPAMEPDRNGYAWVGFDLASLIGPAGPNRIWIDTLELARPDMKFLAGPLVLSGPMSIAIHQPTWIDGGLIVVDGARFESDTTRLVVDGNITTQGPFSSVHVHEGTLRLDQQYRYESTTVAQGGASIRLVDLLFLPGGGGPTGLVVQDGAICKVERCSFPRAGFTATIQRNGRIELLDSGHPGEFILGRDGQLVADRLTGVLLWLDADDGLRATLDQVQSGPLTSWTLGPGWGRSATLTSIGRADFGLIVRSGCNLTVQNSQLLALGLVFDEGLVKLVGYQNKTTYANTTFPWPGRNVSLVGVTVDAWNFYSTGAAHLTVSDSLFGELLAFDNSFARVVNSTCDGTGGYFGARDSSVVEVEDSHLLCDVTNDGLSLMHMLGGSVTGPVTAAGSAIIGFTSCALSGPLVELENGRIVVR